MSATPARDALDVLAENMARETSTSLIDATDVTTWLTVNPDLVLAALIESGWRPTDDQLRAMGGSEASLWDSFRGGHVWAWRFPKEATDGE